MILETLTEAGYSSLRSILICGGLSNNPLFIQTQADVAKLPVVRPQEPESVLVGSAILGACAAKHFPSLKTGILHMGGQGEVVHPNCDTFQYHELKYKVFKKMYDHQKLYQEIMGV